MTRKIRAWIHLRTTLDFTLCHCAEQLSPCMARNIQLNGTVKVLKCMYVYKNILLYDIRIYM